MTVELTDEERQVAAWMWPHIDFGKSQVSIHILEADKTTWKHGQEVTFGSHFVFDRPGGLAGSPYKKQYKGTFRLFEKDVDKDWIAKHLPIAKRVWEKRLNVRGE